MKILCNGQKSRFISLKKISVNMKTEQFKNIQIKRQKLSRETENNEQQSVEPYQAIPEGQNKKREIRNKVEEIG